MTLTKLAICCKSLHTPFLVIRPHSSVTAWSPDQNCFSSCPSLCLLPFSFLFQFTFRTPTADAHFISLYCVFLTLLFFIYWGISNSPWVIFLLSISLLRLQTRSPWGLAPPFPSPSGPLHCFVGVALRNLSDTCLFSPSRLVVTRTVRLCFLVPLACKNKIQGPGAYASFVEHVGGRCVSRSL